MSLTPMDWPAGLFPARCEFGLQKQMVQHRSELAGTLQAVGSGAEFWRLTLGFDARSFADSGELEALLNTLSGGEQPVLVWHFARPMPQGTMRGAPTLAANVPRFARQLDIQTTPGATLLKSDMIKVGQQLFQSATNAVADGSGLLVVNTVNRVRVPMASGSLVLWNKPAAQFVWPDVGSRVVHSMGKMQGTSIALEELL